MFISFVFRAFQNAISCEENRLDSLQHLINSFQITVRGQCSYPFEGESLQELATNSFRKSIITRIKRSNDTSISPSILLYNTTGMEIVNSCTLQFSFQPLKRN